MTSDSQKQNTATPGEDQPTANESSTRPLSIIGIGASAGGLTALRSLFTALPATSGLTFVVVVHLAPAHDSMLAELLQSATAMPVTQVTDSVTMQPDHVYVIPPAKQLSVTAYTLTLTDLPPTRTRPLQIDTFFRSLAEAHGDGAAIILSGTGTDGAVGILAIKEKGGLILVQSPEEAEYDGMPRSAIATGVVDVVAPVAILAQRLVAAKQTTIVLPLVPSEEALPADDEQTLRQLLAHLRLRTGYDFSGYKRATLLRRLTRRLQLAHLTTLTAYLHRVRQDGDEVMALFHDLLIHVTAFFRDPEAWEALVTVMPNLFAGKGRADTVRVWSMGCATGEEAYSLAILLQEYADTLPDPPMIQIFASDLGPDALAIARAGVYPQAIAADINAERLTRFFIADNGHYRVRPELRERILFAHHNLLQDPPFSRLDLLVCRNVLIYLQRDLQTQIFQTFAYALRPNGVLFLGNAETSDGNTELFVSLDKRHRLYQRRMPSGSLPRLSILPPTVESYGTIAAVPHAAQEHRLVLEAAGVPSVLVDRDYSVLHLSADAGRYLVHPQGTLTSDLLRLVRPELQAALYAALISAFEAGKTTATRPVPVRFNGSAHPVYLLVRPHQLVGGQPRALVVFLEVETVGPEELAIPVGQIDATGNVAMEAELHQIQGQLQTLRREYETTVADLRVANEEWQSTNEEYKSTLEELETSKEELQSMNEELQTVNQELQTKMEETLRVNDDLQNLFAATDIATLFLDRALHIKRYTPAAVALFNFLPADKGRPLAHLRTTLHYEELVMDAQRVLATLLPLERDVEDQTGLWFLVRIRPYRTLADQIDGVIITFVDITERRNAQDAMSQAREYAEKIVDTVRESLLILTPDLHVLSANASFYEHFQITPAETEGRMLYELGTGQWQIPALRTLLEDVLPDNDTFSHWEMSHDFPKLGRRTMLLNGRRVDHLQLILLAIEDITERKQAETALHQLNATLEEQVTQRTAQVRALASTLTLAEQEERRRIAQILHDDLQQQLYGIQMRMLSIEMNASLDPTLLPSVQEAYSWLDESIQVTRQLTVDISPPILKAEGLTDALGWLGTRMTATHGLQVEVQAAHSFLIPDEDMRVLIIQFVRELLFNVVKHAATDQALIELQEGEGDTLQLTVSDAGRGFDVAQAMANQGGGFGLFSVRERLGLFGGRMDIVSAPGQGTRITLTIPLVSQPPLPNV